MITQEKSTITEDKFTDSELKATFPIKYIANKFREIGTLRRRLLISILPAVLLPLAIASGLGYTITERRAKTEVLEKLKNHAVVENTTIVAFIQDSFNMIDLVAANPEVIQAMKAGSETAREQELTEQTITNLEQEFADTKLLTVNDSLNNYLQQMVKSGQVVEIFVTERNGFNIASSNPTSDFVQSDEDWWKTSQQKGLALEEPEFDESANTNVIPFSQAIKDPQTGEFLGVIKAGVPVTRLNSKLTAYLDSRHQQASQLQIVDPDDSFVLYTTEQEESEANTLEDLDDRDDEDAEGDRVIGGESITETIETLVKVEGNSSNLEEEKEAEAIESSLSLKKAQQLIAQQSGFSDVNVHQEKIFSETSTLASFKYQNKIYTLATVPNTDYASISVVDYEVIAAEARNLLTVFALTAIVLGIASAGLITLLAQQLSRPLTNLSEKTQQVTAGHLDTTASIEGTIETRTLANNFNQLVVRVKDLLQEQKNIAEQQRQEKEQLEAAIYTLIDEISDATEGDLTVRASLDSLELSTVADLFNAIIDNLQEIAIETKQSTSQVGSSLKQSEEAIRFLAGQAIAEAKATRNTLSSIEQMSKSIKAVAENARQAEKIAEDTHSTVLNSTNDMDLTVDSILELRNTVGETAKKMKRLGESNQKISQVVSFIEEIALKTNVLAINASVEARRAGEYGQGFTIVAEQVGALAEQSAAATKEIANIVGKIQAETYEVSQVMESGTAQVVDTTHLVESTKKSLGLVLEKSQKINQLMRSISRSTISQASTSQNVTNLMQRIAQLSDATSKSSDKVAQSIFETAEIAKKLESAVAKFKVAK